MAVAVTVDIPGGTEQQYEQVIAMGFPDGKLPEGFLVHLAGPTETGWRVLNVVESQGQFEAFARERLRPALQQAGEGDVTPQLTFFIPSLDAVIAGDAAQGVFQRGQGPSS
jgi:hypothetical protein